MLAVRPDETTRDTMIVKVSSDCLPNRVDTRVDTRVQTSGKIQDQRGESKGSDARASQTRDRSCFSAQVKTRKPRNFTSSSEVLDSWNVSNRAPRKPRSIQLPAFSRRLKFEIVSDRRIRNSVSVKNSSVVGSRGNNWPPCLFHVIINRDQKRCKYLEIPR